ncbi:MAG: ABC-F family ATP-binding cassette domain-containing protein [Desulfarculaceae bacterium]|nr:ABC-F family ATP-binding cassette domain-containing protein [Desulfarculaceae bacterium]
MQSLISIKNAGKSYGNHDLFTGLDFELNPGEKLGLIGANGSGKSTLLKLAAGITDPDEGRVSFKNTATSLYVPQQDEPDPSLTVEQVIENRLRAADMNDEDIPRYLNRAMGEAGFKDGSVLAATLSGGWKKRLCLTRALACQPAVLLLDEPTNHLDITGILWLEAMLKEASFSFIVVSHDRRFIDRTCGSVMEIGKQYPGGYLKVKGRYDRFTVEKEKFLATQKKKESALANKMRREDQWLGQGPKARTSKARYRIDQAELLRSELEQVKHRNSNTASVDIDFSTTGRKTRRLVEVSGIAKSLDGKELFRDLSLNLTKGTCTGIVGENGSGKSTLMHIIGKKTEPDTGEVKWTQNLKAAVFEQHEDSLGPDITLKEALSPTGKDSVVYNGRTLHIVSWAKKFLFSPDTLDMPVKKFSGGEKAKMRIARIMLEPVDLLLFDEPTNDLDIPSLEVLEKSLLEFPGAVVLVSHDRYLLDHVTDTLLYLDGKGGAETVKSFSQIMEKKNKSRAGPGGQKKAREKQENRDVSKKPKSGIAFGFKEKFELEHMEENILSAESEVSSLEERVQSPEVLGDPERLNRLCSELQKAKDEVDRLYDRWETLEEKKERAGNQ